MMGRAKPCAVIFDMDGVLVDSGELHYHSWRELEKELGVSMSREFFRNTFGMDNRRIIPMLLGHPVAEDKLTLLSERKEEFFRQEAREKLELLPGVKELIHELAAKGFVLAIATSGPRKNLEVILERLGMADKFSVLVSGDEVERGKPAPDIFLLAASKLDCLPEHCIVIEDATQGIEAARNAGMKCVAVATTHSRHSLASADRVVNSLTEITAEDFHRLLEGR